MNSIEWRGKPYEQTGDTTGSLLDHDTELYLEGSHTLLCSLLIHLHHLYLLALIT